MLSVCSVGIGPPVCEGDFGAASSCFALDSGSTSVEGGFR